MEFKEDFADVGLEMEDKKNQQNQKKSNNVSRYKHPNRTTEQIIDEMREKGIDTALKIGCNIREACFGAEEFTLYDVIMKRIKNGKPDGEKLKKQIEAWKAGLVRNALRAQWENLNINSERSIDRALAAEKSEKYGNKQKITIEGRIETAEKFDDMNLPDESGTE